jgi:hypothetical protein
MYEDHEEFGSGFSHSAGYGRCHRKCTSWEHSIHMIAQSQEHKDSQGAGSSSLSARRVPSVTLAYKVKLHPTRVKGDMLGLLCNLFRREQHEALDFLDGVVAQEGKLLLKGKSQAGQGEFAQRVQRRAFLDWQRARKAARATKQQMKLPYLKAEMCDAAEVQEPRKATGFDLWVHMEGLSKDCQLYLPAKNHKALNRALEQPGATLSKAAQVFRKNGKWYAWVYVKCPLQPVYEPKGWYGNDVGVRASVTRSDGYQGPDLRPTLERQRQRQGERQRQGYPADFGQQTPQRQALAYEARLLVSVALAAGRGIALEDPKRLPRWKQWAARYFAKRVVLLASLVGVPVRLVNPPYTSQTCPVCSSRDTFRGRTLSRCRQCGYTHNSDFWAARNIAHRACDLRSREKVTSSLHPGGGEA